MRRREFVGLLGGAAMIWSITAGAQQLQRMRRIGVLLLAAADDPELQTWVEAFLQELAVLGWSREQNVRIDIHWATANAAEIRKHATVLLLVNKEDPEFQRRVMVAKQALQELGWTEKNTSFEYRYADGKLDRLRALAPELVRAKVDVILTQGTDSTEAARNATSTIPIVMASIGDAVGTGITTSLARPGGNVTGLSLFATEQSTKRLELIKDISPGLSRMAVFWNGNNGSHRLQLKEMETAMPVLGLALRSVPVRDRGELEAGFRTAVQAGTQAVVTMDDQLINFLRARIVELAMRHKLPVMGEFRPMTAAGGLMNYGPNQINMWRQAAGYIDKIFKGAKPGNLPIEQPSQFELVINLKTAKALGIAVPHEMLRRADEVIE
jgi:putative ABC transport system substrate-binding protein